MKVKIITDKGQSMEEAEELLYKALDTHRQGAQHGESFADPVMDQLFAEMKENYGDIYDDMLQAIFEELDKERK